MLVPLLAAEEALEGPEGGEVMLVPRKLEAAAGEEVEVLL